MRKSELMQTGVGLLTLAATAGVVFAVLLWWRLHPAWAVALGALTFLAGYAVSSAVAFAWFVRDISRTVPCPRCHRALSVLNLRADGQPVRCPTCGVLPAGRGASETRPAAVEPATAADRAVGG